MKTKKIIEDELFVHKEHNEWLSQLNFFQDEIKFFQNELIKIIHKHNWSFSSIESVEEYRDILLKKIEHIDQLRHAIMQHDRELAFPPEMDTAELRGHQEVRKQFLAFKEQYNLMKKNFKRFAAYND